MLLWINGAFGAGKTQTAYALSRRLPGAYVYDPENLGFFLRDNLPATLGTDDFQDYPQWREWNCAMLTYMAEHYTGDILIPMTVTDSGYFHEMTDTLATRFVFRHVILTAEKETIKRRLHGRGERKNCWAEQQMDRCMAAFGVAYGENGYLPGDRILTDGLTVEEVAETVASLAGLTLIPDNRSRMQRMWDRKVVWLRHVRW